MSAFDYVMTPAAVVIGLAFTHLMQGVGRIVVPRPPLQQARERGEGGCCAADQRSRG